jgi:hypothetical protein
LAEVPQTTVYGHVLKRVLTGLLTSATINPVPAVKGAKLRGVRITIGSGKPKI